jgi:hypothetical protein
MRNEDIFERLFDKGEEVLWSGKPHTNFKPKTLKEKYFSVKKLIIPIIFSLILTIIINYILTLGPDTLYKPGPLETLGIFIVISIFVYICILDIEGDSQLIVINEMLYNTEYFLTNKKIFSINKRKNTMEIVNCLISEIAYFYIEELKEDQNTYYQLILEVIHKNDETRNNTILFAKPLEDFKLHEEYKVQLVPDEGWYLIYHHTADPISFYQLNNLIDIAEITDILINKLGIKTRKPPPAWQGVFEFFNPY